MRKSSCPRSARLGETERVVPERVVADRANEPLRGRCRRGTDRPSRRKRRRDYADVPRQAGDAVARRKSTGMAERDRHVSWRSEKGEQRPEPERRAALPPALRGRQAMSRSSMGRQRTSFRTGSADNLYLLPRKHLQPARASTTIRRRAGAVLIRDASSQLIVPARRARPIWRPRRRA